MKRQLGMHSVEVDGDLVLTQLNGHFTLADMKDFYALAEELTKQGPLYILADMNRGGSIEAKARRYAVNNGSRVKIAATAVYGVNLVLKTILTLLTRATALHNRAKGNVAFFTTETPARAFLQTVRERSARFDRAP